MKNFVRVFNEEVQFIQRTANVVDQIIFVPKIESLKVLVLVELHFNH